MPDWKHAIKEGVVAGSMASVLSTAVLVAMARRETGHHWAATNAISHWIWGDSALHKNSRTLKHTLAGYLIHHGTSVFWATLYAKAFGQRQEAKTVARAVPAAMVASTLACFVDYQLTPKRLTPGFEHRLSSNAMLAVYAAFGIGLALGSLAMPGQAEQIETVTDDEAADPESSEVHP